jgi:8-oxo-dGTP pyrophosphatase MutT (NUDIX family)
VLREMKEELGTDKFKIVKTIPCFYQYKWPKINQLCHGYRGQKQDLFILEFIGKDEDIELDHKEHIDFKWVAVDEVVSAVHQIRKEQAEKAIEKLRLKIRIEE